MRHPTEEQLVAFRFGDTDPDETAAIGGHLSACETCRAAAEAIGLTLSAASQLPVPDRPETYGAEVWARIAPRLQRPATGWLASLEALVTPRRLALAGGLALLILAAFVAGRHSLRSGPHTAAGEQGAQQQAQRAGAQQGQARGKEAGSPAGPNASPQIRQGILLVAVGDHLERSQMALAEIVNAADAASVDISTEQAWARDLVVENRLYRQTAEETGEAAVASVLDDLERVLVEVANGPSELSTKEFEGVRKRIESQGIIFKVRVLGERVREREARPAADGRTI
jgi:hypothetical protein